MHYNLIKKKLGDAYYDKKCLILLNTYLNRYLIRKRQNHADKH